MIRLKAWLAAVGALVALLALLFRGKNPWEERAKKATEGATAAKVEAINAKADLEKEIINNEAQQKLDDLAAMSDDDLAAAITAEYNNRPGAEAGGHLEDPPAGE